MTLQISQDNSLVEIDQMQILCKKLMQTPHFAKMGEVGVFAIVQKAKSMGMNPLDALSGSMYFVQGKVEMSGQSMLALIRSKGHSVSMDPKSTDTKVIMFGKRCDNNDSWRAEFGIEDAKRAGIYRNQWEKMPRVMCMWRCVSQLGRFLFSDILKGVYVQGEISDSPAFDTPVSYEGKITEIETIKPMTINSEMAEEIKLVLSKCSTEYQKSVSNFMQKAGITSYNDIPMDTFNRLMDRAIQEKNEEEARLSKSQEIKTEDLFEGEIDED